MLSQMARFHYFLWLSNIPLCVCVCVCVCVYHSFFIQSSIDGCLGMLAIVNNTAMNRGVHIFFSSQHFGIFLFTYLFIFGCVGSSLLHVGFL